MEDRKLGKSIFILSATALAVAAGLALYALFLAPAETYAPPTVGAGRAATEPEPEPVLCDEADIPPPEGGVPEGYVWRVKPEACFGYPLPDFAFVMPIGQYAGRTGRPSSGSKTHDIIMAEGGYFQTMQVGLVGGEDVSLADRKLISRLEARPDGANVIYNEVERYECGMSGGICTGLEALVEFPDGRLIIVAVSAFPKAHDYETDSEIPGLTEVQVVGIVETVARLVRLK